jgi:signal transduction histidine kinase
VSSDERPERTAAGRRVRSARVRVVASVVALLAFSTLASVLIQRQILISRAGERVDDAMTQEIDEFRRLVREGRNPLTGRPFGGDIRAIFDVYLRRNIPAEREHFFTFVEGRPNASTADASERELTERVTRRLSDVDETRRGTLDVPGDGEVRYLAVPVVVEGNRRGVFVVTIGLSGEREEVTEAFQVAAGVSLGVLLLASVLAWAAAGRVLAPLRELTTTARSISETDLTKRINVQGDDEIAQLGRTFNEMLDRLERAFASQRAFVSDAGHELRTPITIIRGHLELLGDDPEERRETLAVVRDELDRMSRFVDDLVTLAKAERPDFLELEDIDLDVLMEELMAKAAALARRDWQLDRMGAGRMRVDRQRLTQAMMNLAQNAVEHTAPGDVIGLGGELRDGHARMWVRDTGPGVADADRERIFERFARASGGRRRSEGAGLGLAIVRTIAEAHGGRVELASRPGDGATFTLDIPTVPPGEDSE